MDFSHIYVIFTVFMVPSCKSAPPLKLSNGFQSDDIMFTVFSVYVQSELLLFL